MKKGIPDGIRVTRNDGFCATGLGNGYIVSMPEPTCLTCKAACCCQEAMLFNDTDVPPEYVYTGPDGRQSMLRLEDGFCAALDRDEQCCGIYELRPWICREFEEGGEECLRVWVPKNATADTEKE